MLRRINQSVFLLLLLAATGGSFFLYREHHSPEVQQYLKQIEAERNRADAEKRRADAEEAEKKRFMLFVQRLKATNRVAEIMVHDPSESGTGQVLGEYLTFTEIDDAGRDLDSREFWIEGKRAHIDAQVVKFDSSYVEQGDPLMGRSVVLFRHLYDEGTSPSRAHEIDQEGAVPPNYRTSDPAASQYQKALWGKFWNLVDDPELRKTMHVRVAQGEGVWCDFNFGYKYKISVDANGGINIVNEKLPAVFINALKSHQQHVGTTAPAHP